MSQSADYMPAFNMIVGLNQEIRKRVYDLLEPAHAIFELRWVIVVSLSTMLADALYLRSQKIELNGYRVVRFYLYIFSRLNTGVC